MALESDAKRIFVEATEQPATERAAFIKHECAGDESLRQRVERLLAAHDESSLDELFESGPEEQDGRSAPHAGTPPRQIGPYRISGVLGEGGMGVVYEAEQEHPRRLVALKVVRPGLASRRALARFELEAEILGRLTHPGIARIYEAGTTGEGAAVQPYFAMELVRGRPLMQHAEEARQGAGLGLRERMELMARICEAVDHAHRCGVVHRDLKPANILVDENGQPKILDFGVARLSEPGTEDSHHTVTGELVGTVSYMSPEQVSGTPGALDHRSDVYALGLITYQLATGVLPYRLEGLSVYGAVEAIREQEARPARERNREVDADLDTVLLKALEKEPERRYASAQALADDLGRWLAHETILARPATRIYRLRKFARRNPFLVGGIAAVLVVTTLGSVGTSIGMLRAHDRADLYASKSRHFEAAVEDLNRGRGGKSTTFADVLARAAPRIEEDFARWPKERADEHASHGRMFRHVGEHEAALEQFEKAVAALEELRRAPKERQFEALMGAATTALELQDMARAEQYFAAAERVLPGSGGVQYAEHLALRAGAAHDLGDYELAEHMVKAAMAVQAGAAFEAEEDRQRARAIDAVNLSRLLVDRGRIKQAVALAREAVALREEAGDEGTRGWAFSMLTLGYALHAAEEWEEAERACREAVATYERLDDGEGPMVAISRMDLAGLVADRSGGEGASVVVDREALGDLAHVEVISLRNRARLLWRRGAWARSAELFERALKRAQEIGGPATPVWISHTLMARGLVMGEGGDWRGALAPLRGAVDARPESLPAQAALGRALVETGSPSEAEPLLQRVLERRRETVGEIETGSLPTIAARIDLAACLAALGRAEKSGGLIAAAEDRIPAERSDLLARLRSVQAALQGSSGPE